MRRLRPLGRAARQRLGALLLAGPILAGAVPALAQTSGQNTGLRSLDHREAVLGWEAVGRLDTGRQGFCTATLIAPDLVLTAAHCVFQNARPRDPATMLFRAGLHNGAAIAERQVAAVAVPRAYRPIAHLEIANVPHDVALLRLAQPITSAEADPFILHQGAIAGEAISVTSYGEGRTEALSRQRRCQIVGRQAPLMAFDCDVTFGSSGAPVFVHGAGGSRGRILSIISGGGMMDGGMLSLGMDLPQVVAELKADLRRQSAAAPAPGVRILGSGDGKASSGAKFVRPGGS